MGEDKKENLIGCLVKVYKYSAIMVLNILILFCVLNVACFVYLQINDYFVANKNPITRKYGKPLDKLYPDLKKDEIDNLLIETWSRPYAYEPFTQLKEKPFSGKYVNVDENGFRFTKDQGPWPLDKKYFNVFLLGGSTTFGYGVPDNQTIGSYLQELFSKDELGKELKIYNFGRGHYFSTQERILYEQLLVSGHIPDIAIFIDGLNDFYYKDDKPLFTSGLEKFVEGKVERRYFLSQVISDLPVLRVFQPQKHQRVSNIFVRDFYEFKKNDILKVINRYINNKKIIEAISAEYDVNPIFVWQPVPTYKYDLKYHLFARGGFGNHIYSSFGYNSLSSIKNVLGNNFLWCADMQEGLKEPLYVDVVHYSAKMSKKFAAEIHRQILERNLVVYGQSNI